MSEEQAVSFDNTKPHSVNQQDNRVSTLDQNGVLYDGVTFLPLSVMDKEKYAIPEGAPFSKMKTTQEKIADAIATIRASGAVDADSLSKFDRMFRNMLSEEGATGANKPAQVEVTTSRTIRRVSHEGVGEDKE